MLTGKVKYNKISTRYETQTITRDYRGEGDSQNNIFRTKSQKYIGDQLRGSNGLNFFGLVHEWPFLAMTDQHDASFGKVMVLLNAMLGRNRVLRFVVVGGCAVFAKPSR